MPNMAAIVPDIIKSCCPTILLLIAPHHRAIAETKINCPLEGKCRESSIVYKACLLSGSAANNYYGCCENGIQNPFQ